MINLTVTNLGKHFGFRWIFRELSFNAASGVVGIAGTNGSGKSTLMRCLAGLYMQDVGEVSWTIDDAPADRSALRENSGYSGPYIQHYGELTCRENLQFLSGARADPQSDDHIRSCLDEAGILFKENAMYKSLSSGQQQRLKIIAANLHRPRILFLDEPGTNLDERGHAFIEQVIEQRRNPNYLTILASNDASELRLCDEVITIPDATNEIKH